MSATVLCPACSHSNDHTARVCAQCGKPLVQGAASVRQSPPRKDWIDRIDASNLIKVLVAVLLALAAYDQGNLYAELKASQDIPFIGEALVILQALAVTAPLTLAFAVNLLFLYYAWTEESTLVYLIPIVFAGTFWLASWAGNWLGYPLFETATPGSLGDYNSMRATLTNAWTVYGPARFMSAVALTGLLGAWIALTVIKRRRNPMGQD